MEHFFATHLVDYDPIINSGNWQQVAFVGVSSRPPSQYLKANSQVRFDKDKTYSFDFSK
jgi:deoxyribodipyrimidine photolyase